MWIYTINFSLTITTINNIGTISITTTIGFIFTILIIAITTIVTTIIISIFNTIILIPTFIIYITFMITVIITKSIIIIIIIIIIIRFCVSTKFFLINWMLINLPLYTHQHCRSYYLNVSQSELEVKNLIVKEVYCRIL